MRPDRRLMVGKEEEAEEEEVEEEEEVHHSGYCFYFAIPCRVNFKIRHRV